jgi:hypothetical protein
VTFTKHRSAANVVAAVTVVSSTTEPPLQNLEGERNGLSMNTIAATLDNYRTPIGLSPSLQRPTLVLNRNWQPINVATVARALIMLWNDSAKIVDPVDYQTYDWSDFVSQR